MDMSLEDTLAALGLDDQATVSPRTGNIVTCLRTGGFSWSRLYTSVPSTMTLAPVSTTASKGVLCTSIRKVNALGGHNCPLMHWSPLSPSQAMVLSIQPPGSSAANPLGLSLAPSPPAVMLPPPP